MKFKNWGHVYGIIFNELNYETVINSMIDCYKTKGIYSLNNEEEEMIFISKFQETQYGYAFLVGRTNEEVSKTKFDTKKFTSKDIDFEEFEHISDYTHIFISKNSISETGNSFYLLLEKNQRIQIGTVKKLIGNILGYYDFVDRQKSKIYIGSILIADYIKKLFHNEIIGKKIIINEKQKNIFDFPDDNEDTTTMVTQISKYNNSTKFLKALEYIMANIESNKDKDIFLEVDDGKNSNRKIPLDEQSLKYVPFFELTYYSKSTNKDINEKIVHAFEYITLNNEYEMANYEE